MNVRQSLVIVAQRLGELLDRAVFVGGATAELLIVDRASGPVRPTDTSMSSSQSRPAWSTCATSPTRSARQGSFKSDMREGAPICRWIVDDVTVDTMPTDESVLGFSNRWYSEGVLNAVWVELRDGVRARVLTGPYFLATKIEAFKGRGRGDYLSSADVEDVVALVDGRPGLLEEVRAASSRVRVFASTSLASSKHGLLKRPFAERRARAIGKHNANRSIVVFVQRPLPGAAWFQREIEP